MTEIDALEKTILIWDWLALHPDEDKVAAYKALRLSLDLNECPLCEATINKASPALVWPYMRCRLCLLQSFWPGRCWVRESAYCLWQYGTPAQRNAAARAIADAARIKLNEVLTPRRIDND